jgi:hypothetical protein
MKNGWKKESFSFTELEGLFLAYYPIYANTSYLPSTIYFDIM